MTEHEEVCKGCWPLLGDGTRDQKLAKENEKLADEGKDVARGCAWSSAAVEDAWLGKGNI